MKKLGLIFILILFVNCNSFPFFEKGPNANRPQIILPNKMDKIIAQTKVICRDFLTEYENPNQNENVKKVVLYTDDLSIGAFCENGSYGYRKIQKNER